MDASLTTRLAAEFIGTAIMIIFGNGAVANVELKGTKGFSSDWFLIAFGYGCGVMIPAVMFGSISGNHLNPAVTLSFAVMAYSLGKMFYHTSLFNSWVQWLVNYYWLLLTNHIMIAQQTKKVSWAHS